MPAKIKGDGKKTIKELIELNNYNEWLLKIEEYLNNHVNWFLKNHNGSAKRFQETVKEMYANEEIGKINTNSRKEKQFPLV